MGLLDSLKGKMMGGAMQAAMSAMANNPQVQQQLLGMLNQGGAGGLKELAKLFDQKGLGDIFSSWVGKGPNQEISVAQLQQVLPVEHIQAMASRYGIEPNQAFEQLSKMLPTLIDQLTPNGQLPNN